MKKDLWKTVFKKFEGIWSALGRPYTSKFFKHESSANFAWFILDYFIHLLGIFKLYFYSSNLGIVILAENMPKKLWYGYQDLHFIFKENPWFPSISNVRNCLHSNATVNLEKEIKAMSRYRQNDIWSTARWFSV